jgi:hypothetical protein
MDLASARRARDIWVPAKVWCGKYLVPGCRCFEMVRDRFHDGRL